MLEAYRRICNIMNYRIRGVDTASQSGMASSGPNEAVVLLLCKASFHSSSPPGTCSRSTQHLFHPAVI